MNRYDWLKDEISKVPKKKFHLLGPGSLEDLAEIETAYGRLPLDYREFVEAFGEAGFYRSPWGDGHLLKIMVPPRLLSPAEHTESGEKTIVQLRLGHFINTGYAWLEWNGRYLNDGEVLAGMSGQRPKLVGRFEEWLRWSFRAGRKLYSKEDWAEILKPAVPFSSREQQIVDAILRFKFRKVGVTPKGNVLVEVQNQSSLKLPYLTVGVRVPGGMVGGVALPVSDIAPGEIKVVEENLYKGSMDPEQVELFRKPLPEPEERSYFAEFRTTPFPAP